MPEGNAKTIHDVLMAADLSYSAMSWNGFNLFGDHKSIEEAKRLLHNSDSRLPVIERLLQEMKNA